MADNLGLLANGDFVLCCLDYEGEMALGNIDQTPVADVLRSERRAAVRRNAMAEALCRRCRGNLFVFDTAPLPAGRNSRSIISAGAGGPGRTVLTGSAAVGRTGKPGRMSSPGFRPGGFVFRSGRISRWSSSPSGDFRLRSVVRRFPRGGRFAALAGRKGDGPFEAAFDFLPGRLYRLEIDSPFFVPDEILHNGDTRRLGLAVFSISIRT